MLDPDGASAAVGQTGHVWFLAGNFVGGTYERSVTLAAGTALFFPLVNNAYLSFATDPLPTESEITGIIADLEDFMAGTVVSCEIDGFRIRDVPGVDGAHPFLGFAAGV